MESDKLPDRVITSCLEVSRTNREQETADTYQFPRILPFHYIYKYVIYYRNENN